MISDRLYALAFEYKKTKLWNILWDTEIFAVKMSDGEIGYISIMGMKGEHCAVGLYIGQKGIDSIRIITKLNQFMISSGIADEMLLQIQCLQCVFEGKDALSEEEKEETKKYARSHGIKIAGKNAYPQFLKYQPNCLPWHLQTDKEEEELCEALAAAIEMAKILKEKTPETIGLKRFTDEVKELPMLEQQNGVYVLGKVKVPKEKPMEMPIPQLCNEIGIAKLKKAKRKGVWECGIVRFPQPIQDNPEDIPVYPVVLLPVESGTNYILPVKPALHYEEEPEKLLSLFIDAFVEEGVCPMQIKVRDKRTHTFVKGFCDKLKVPLNVEKELPALENVKHVLYEHIYANEIEETDDPMEMQMLIQQLIEESKSRTLPDEIKEMFADLLEQGKLPEELEEGIRQIILTEDTNKPKVIKMHTKIKKTISKESFVISVSLGTGCYRHIQISDNSTLLELHWAILDAFNFMDDHAHAFFMDNKIWSELDCYYMDGIEDYYRTTDRYNLKQAGLYKGKKFKYVFDFGDEWAFQCKVLKIVEESTDEPWVVRSKGEAPDQYGY